MGIDYWGMPNKNLEATERRYGRKSGNIRERKGCEAI